MTDRQQINQEVLTPVLQDLHTYLRNHENDVLSGAVIMEIGHLIVSGFNAIELPMPEIVGVSEAAEVLGVGRSSITQMRKRANSPLPEPVAVLRSTPVWRLSDLEKLRARQETVRKLLGVEKVSYSYLEEI